MTSRDARAAVDRALDTLIAQLDAGKSDALVRYLAAMSRFHRYSPHNALLIHVQRPDATRVAGFTTWKKLGRFVKKGEKGIAVLAPCARKAAQVAEEEEDGRALPARWYRSVFVFDVSQTEGAPLPDASRVEGDPGDYLLRLERFAREDIGAAVEYVDGLDGALGCSYGGRIQVLSGLDPAQRFAVLAHECGHELLHWSVPEEVRKDKTLVETQAEAVAFVVCHTVGLATHTAASDYIQLYRGNRETLRCSLEAVHRAAGRILAAIGETVASPLIAD